MPDKHGRVRGHSGYVYLAQCGDLVKIGASTVPSIRISQLSSDLQIRHWLVIEISASDHFLLERTLHRRFAASRVRGEYFRLTSAEVLTMPEVLRQVRRYERKGPVTWREIPKPLSYYEPLPPSRQLAGRSEPPKDQST